MTPDEPRDASSAATASVPGPGEDPTHRRRKGLDGRVIGGRYEVIQTVAAGANTLIADATDRELGRQVTLKLVRPELSESDAFRRRLGQQMDAVAALSHPNLAAVYDWGEERIGKRITVYVVGEYLSGGSMRDLFDRRRLLTPSQALMVGLEACRGLDFAHREGLVHTELTPAKLVFGDDRRLRIVDFGLARILGEQVWSDPSRLRTHVARYASPEQAQGEPIDDKTDVYSLALILVEAVTGTVPFKGESTVSTLSARIGKLMPVSADLGPLAAVLERAGRPEAAERSSASQFGRSLVRAAERMPRPTPIPILSKGVFGEDPSAIRRPNDPTGGIARPPGEPEPVFVPPGPASPADPTGEITAGSPAPVPPAVAARGASVVGAEGSTTGVVAPPEGELEATGAALDAPGAVGTTPNAGGDIDEAHEDLAALVVGTPSPIAFAPDTAPTGKQLSRRQRRRAAKAAKAAKRRKATGAAAPAGPTPAPVADNGPRRHRVLSFLFGLLLVAALAALGFAAWKLFRTPTHEVPTLSGLTEQEALGAVEEFKWDVEMDTTRDDTYDTPGEVVRSSPEAGHDLAEGSPLIIYLSEGPEYRSLPNLAGLTVAEATADLEELRLVPGTTTENFDENVAAGTVLSNSADGATVGENVLPGTPVNLVVSKGPQPRVVPSLRGLTEDQATRLLDQFGLVLAIGEPVFDNDIAVGEVATQTPAAETTLERGGTVTASPSKGPDLVVMPELSGMTLPEIRQALADAGLTAGGLLGSTQGTFYAASVDGDQVDAGDEVLRGSVVDLIVL